VGIVSRIELAQRFALALEQARISMGVTQSQMADKMGMSVSAYKKVVSGDTTKIDMEYAVRLNRLTGWHLSEITGEDTAEAVLLAEYRSLTPSQKRFVSAVAGFEARFKASHEIDAEEYLTVLVPTGDMQDGMIYDSSNIIKIEAGDYYKRYGSRLHTGIMVTSNHLHPVYNKGDILLMCCEPIRDGDTGVFLHKTDGRVYIRRFRQTDPCQLEPINGFGRVFTVSQSALEDLSQWVKFGYVLCKMRR